MATRSLVSLLSPGGLEVEGEAGIILCYVGIKKKQQKNWPYMFGSLPKSQNTVLCEEKHCTERN